MKQLYTEYLAVLLLIPLNARHSPRHNEETLMALTLLNGDDTD